MTRGSALLTAACQALLVGFSVGLYEAVRTFGRPITSAHGAEILLGAGTAYAATALLLTLAIAPWMLRNRRAGAAATGIAVAFALLCAARVSQSVPLGGLPRQVFWRLLLAVTPSAVLGLGIGFVISRISLLRRILPAAAACAVMLGIALERLGQAPLFGIPSWPGTAKWVVIAMAAAGLTMAFRWRRTGAAAVGTSLLVGLVLFWIVARPAPLPRAEVDTPNVVMVTIDTLRADRIGAYGHELAHTPNLDRFAADGIQFLNAVTPIPLTTPAHASLLTGLMPLRHGALKNWTPISARVPTLASRLAEQGYRTAGVVSALVLTDTLSGLASHFHLYDDDLSATDFSDRFREIPLTRIFGNYLRRRGRFPWLLERRAKRTTDRTLAWLADHQDAPFFLWVHYYDPHEPYAPPLPWARKFEPGLKRAPAGDWYNGISSAMKERMVSQGEPIQHLIRMYDGEIAYTDSQVGRILDALDESQLTDNTVVVVASDHGEGLGDHDYYFAHGNYLYEEELRVPLLIRLPEGHPRHRQVAAPVTLIDVVPTLLDYLGMADSFPTEGLSLRPLIEGQDWGGERPTFHGVRPGAWDTNRSIYAVRTGRLKLIWTGAEWRYEGMRVPSRTELYDLEHDPGEAIDLAGDPPDEIEILQELLREYRRRRGVQSQTSRPDAEMMKRLEALGYAGK